MPVLGPSWKTSVIGFVAAVLNYIAGVGVNLPTDRQGWTTLLVSASIFALGAAAKDRNVSNAPAPLPEAKPVTP